MAALLILGKNSDKGILKRKTEISELEEKTKKQTIKIEELDRLNKDSHNALRLLEGHKAKYLDELRSLNFGIVRLEESIK